LIDLFGEQAEFVGDPEKLRAMSIDGSAAHLLRSEFAHRVASRFAETLTVSIVSRPIEVTLYGAIVTTELRWRGKADPNETGTIWYYLIPRPEACVINSFTLDTPPEMRDRPEMAEAKALLAHRIANLRLELEDMRDERAGSDP